MSLFNLHCGVCYRPPGLRTDMNVAFLENLQMYFDKVLSKPDTLVILLGDFHGHYDPALLHQPVVILAVHCIVG